MSTWDCIDPEKETVHMNIIMWSIFSIQQINLWYDTMLTTRSCNSRPPHPVVQAVPARWATSTINPVKSFRACGATTLQTKVNVKFVNGTRYQTGPPSHKSESHLQKVWNWIAAFTLPCTCFCVCIHVIVLYVQKWKPLRTSEIIVSLMSWIACTYCS